MFLLSKRTLASLLVAAVAALTVTAAAGDLTRNVRFEHHRLLRLPRTTALLDAAYALDLDVWARATSHVDLRVGPGQLEKLQAKLGPAFPASSSIQVLSENIQELIDRETLILRQQEAERSALEEDGQPAPVAVDDTFFKAFHRYDEIVGFMRELAAKYPQLVTFKPSFGKSHEGRDLAYMTVTSPKGDKATKKRLFFQGQQHAREWITGITVLFMGYAFASRYGSDARITAVLDKFEYVLVPMANPDGVEYSFTTNRLWRKNRATINGQKLGVDMNRNWPDHWGKGGSSSSPQSDTYMGPSAGSEPEVKALMSLYQTTPNVVAACDVHSYSELILRPYGWTQTRSPDDAAFSRLGDEINKALTSKGEHAYTNQRVVDLYVASGGASDWFSDEGAKRGQIKPYGISFELPPSQADGGWGGQGFIIAPARILPVAESIAAAALTMAEYAEKNPLGVKA